jgi:class 3 adenylate cyclase
MAAREALSMRCTKCQFENREGARFCKDCGARLELVCPKCKAAYEPNSKFCDECGQDLRANFETPTVDYSEPQSYTPKFLADKILTHRSAIEGERKLVTVLFADVAKYTAMAEKLDPEVVHQIMDGCFNILMNEIHKYEGTINQFTGDGIMALFGAPVAHEDHAQRTCHAALSIQKLIAEYGDKIANDLNIDFKMRIGINSGPVVVGAIGDDLRMDYTAIGDTTNLASRMESLAAPGAVFVSEATHKLVKDFFEFKTLNITEIKGKEKPQKAYELIKPGAIETRIEASAAKGLSKFVGRKNSMAALQELLEKVNAASGQVVGIVGEAGVGKSRLILELRQSLLKNEYTFLEGKCLHYGGSMAFLPVLDILKIYFDIKEGGHEAQIKEKMKAKILQLD